MHKKIIVLFVFIISVACHFTVFAEEVKVSNTPPSWVSQSEYGTFKDTGVYEKDVWEKILTLRLHAEKGELETLYNDVFQMHDAYKNDYGVTFELGLIGYKNLSKLNETNKEMAAKAAQIVSGDYEKLNGSQEGYLLKLWKVKTDAAIGVCFKSKAIEQLSQYPQFNRFEFLKNEIFEQFNKTKEYLYSTDDFIYIDGKFLDPDVIPMTVNDRKLVPIRNIGDELGVTTDWQGESKTVGLKKDDLDIILTIDSHKAIVNGKELTLEVAPMIHDGKTVLPLRFVSEQLGAKVEWVKEKRIILISSKSTTEENPPTEIKEPQLETKEETKAAESVEMEEELQMTDPKQSEDYISDEDMLKWIIGTAAIINYQNSGNPRIIGESRDSSLVARSRSALSDSWSTENADDLRYQITALIYRGHNTEYMNIALILRSLPENEYNTLLSNANDVERYMYPYVKYLDNRWGEKGIAAWDLFRVGTLVSWGYGAGYIDQQEALELMRPAAVKIKNTFTNWEEAVTNYLEGYCYWGRYDINSTSSMYTKRVEAYRMLYSAQKDIFDDSLFSNKTKNL